MYYIVFYHTTMLFLEHGRHKGWLGLYRSSDSVPFERGGHMAFSHNSPVVEKIHQCLPSHASHKTETAQSKSRSYIWDGLKQHKKTYAVTDQESAAEILVCTDWEWFNPDAAQRG